MLSPFRLIPERNGRTDRQTDRQTDKFAISISRVSMLTRDKKIHVQTFNENSSTLLYWALICRTVDSMMPIRLHCSTKIKVS